MGKTLIWLAAAVLASTAQAQDKVNISIATGPTGGVYYPLGGGIANVLSKYVPGYSANAESTAGSVANLQFMNTKKSDMALSMVDAALDGYRDQGKFSGGAVPVRTLMVAYPNRMHVVTVEGRGINSFADLKGKRVSSGPPNSATELMAFRVLEAYGFNWDNDIKRERLDVGKSSEAIKDNKIDAYFWVGGLPTSAVTDLAATPGTKIKLIDHTESVDRMNKKYGQLYVPGTIPAKTYPGQEKDGQIAVVWNLLVARADMPDQVAYTVLKTIFDKKQELINVHKEAASFDYKNQSNAAAAIPFHPGAIKYFAEHGIKLN